MGLMPRPQKPSIAPDYPCSVAFEVRHLRLKVEELIRIIGPLVTKQQSASERSRKLGVSRSTLWRREQRARARLALL